MGLKEKMMDGMMGNMSSEEKQEMMNQMMEKFFSSMSAEDRQKMMDGMMEKMMGMMGGGKTSGGMMEMMKNMMGEGGSEMPWDMCRKMMSSFQETANTAKFANQEVRDLFEDWARQIEEEILQFVKGDGSANPDKVAEHFKLSKESALFFLNRLAGKGKIKFSL